MKVYLLTIGDEILIGQIIDTNSARIAQMLHGIGGVVVEKSAVADDEHAILDMLRRGLTLADVVIITGGLGPTKDDKTKTALAHFFGVGMVEHSPTREFVEDIYRQHKREITPAVVQQWMVPANATVLFNKMGTAPGMWFEQDDKVVVSLPGVPFEMQYLMENEVLPRLRNRFDGTHIAYRTILTSGEGESTIAKMLEPFEDSLPENVTLAYLPRIAQVRLRLTVRGEDPEANEALLNQKLQEMLQLLPPKLIASMEDDVLESAVGKLLRSKGLTLATAESCTGGYLAHLITSVAGSSDYFKGSVIAYANEVKMQVLGVQESTLREHGAVSEQTVREMVQGALKVIGTDLAVATSGIAGPGGGTPEKPVGTVWIAVGNKDRVKARVFHFRRDRQRNIEYAATYALEMLRRFVGREVERG
jgi:nicotinamide-nucleotide amidase